MPEPGEIRILKVADELHICPACGYALGFHMSFVHASAGKDNPIKSTRDVYRVILICPGCGARFDVGWRISFSEFESRFVKTPVNPVVTAQPAAPPVPAAVPVARLLPAPGDQEDPPHE